MHYFIPLAYDRIRDNEGRGTKARCQVLIDYAKKIISEGSTRPSNCYFISTAGFTKESPTKPTQTAPESLAEQIGRYVRSKGFIQVVAEPLAWGTYLEIQKALEIVEVRHLVIIQELRTAKEDLAFLPHVDIIGVPKVVISTNLGHMPRVRLCCYFLKMRMKSTHVGHSSFEFVSAPHKFSKKEWFQETFKFFQYLWNFLSGKW